MNEKQPAQGSTEPTCDECEIELLDLPPGSPAPGAGIGDLLKYLPVLLAFLEGLLSGQAEIPAFTVRLPMGKKRVGPIPITNA